MGVNNSEKKLTKENEDKAKDKEIKIEDAKRLYPVNESLLQSYRRIFISSESFMLSVGFLQFNYKISPVLFYTIILLNLIIILFGWVDIVRARAKLVDYYKYKLNLSCDDSDKFLKNHKYRREVYDSLGVPKGKKHRKGPWRETRIKIDLILPVLYIAVWWLIFCLSRLECKKNCVDGCFANKPSWVIVAVIVITVAGFIWNVWSEFRSKNLKEIFSCFRRSPDR